MSQKNYLFFISITIALCGFSFEIVGGLHPRSRSGDLADVMLKEFAQDEHDLVLQTVAAVAEFDAKLQEDARAYRKAADRADTAAEQQLLKDYGIEPFIEPAIIRELSTPLQYIPDLTEDAAVAQGIISLVHADIPEKLFKKVAEYVVRLRDSAKSGLYGCVDTLNSMDGWTQEQVQRLMATEQIVGLRDSARGMARDVKRSYDDTLNAYDAWTHKQVQRLIYGESARELRVPVELEERALIVHVAKRVDAVLKSAPGQIKAMYNEYKFSPSQVTRFNRQAFSIEESIFLKGLCAESLQKINVTLKECKITAEQLKKVPVTKEQTTHDLRAMRNLFSDIGSLGAALAHANNNLHTVSKLQTIGESSFKLIERANEIMAIEKAIELGTASFEAYFVPYAGAAMLAYSLVTTLISLNESGDENTQFKALHEAIHDAVVFLSQKLDYIITRMDQTDRKIDANHRQALYAFYKIGSKLDDIEHAVVEAAKEMKPCIERIEGGIQHVVTKMSENHKEIRSGISGLYTTPADRLINTIHTTLKRAEHGITSKELIGFIEQLHYEVTKTALGASTTGSDIDATQLDRVAKALEHKSNSSVFTHPAYSHINLVKKMGEQYSPEHINKSSDIANPLLLQRCAETLCQLLEHAAQKGVLFEKEIDKTLALEQLREVLALAEETFAVIVSLKQQPHLQKLLEDCKVHLVHIAEMAHSSMDVNYDQALQGHILRRIVKAMGDDRELLRAQKLEFDGLKKQLTDMYDYMYRNMYVARDLTGPSAHSYRWSFKDSGLYSRFERYLPAGTEVAEVFENLYSPLTILVKKKHEYAEKLESLQEVLIKKHQEKKHIAQMSLRDIKNIMRPLSLLVYPADSKAHQQLLVFEDMAVDPVYCYAELLGLGLVRAEYTVHDDRFSISLYYIYDEKKELIKTLSQPYTGITTTDEDIYNVWYGGRYALPDERINLYQKVGFPSENQHRLLYKPHYPALGNKPGACSLFVDGAVGDAALLESVKKMVHQEETKWRLAAHKHTLADGALITKLHEYDVRYKMLESAQALAYDEEFNENPACELFRNDDKKLLKNQTAVMGYLHDYARPDSHLAESSEYMPVEATLRAYAAAQHAVMEAPQPRAMFIQGALDFIRQAVAHASGIPIREEQEDQPSAVDDASSQEIARVLKQYGEDIHELKDGLGQARGDIAHLRTEMHEQFSQTNQLLQRMLGFMAQRSPFVNKVE